MSAVRTVAVVAVVLGVASGLTGPAAAGISGGDDSARTPPSDVTMTASENSPMHDGVEQTVTYRRTPNETGSIRATHSYRIGADVSSLVVYDYRRGAVLESEGFVRHRNDRWTWDGETAKPSLTFRMDVNRSGRHFRGLEWVDTEEWVLSNVRTAFTYRSYETSDWVYSWQDTDRIRQRTRVAGDGYAGPSVAYLGDCETAATEGDGQTLRLVRPSGAEMAEPPGRVLRTLRRASEQLRVGARDDEVNVFVGPEPLRRGGKTVDSVNGTQDFWVTANATVAPPGNTWVHEYVHTRQNATFGPGMVWFREASASYYAGLLSARQGVGGERGFEEFVADLRVDAAGDAVLADRTSWPTPLTPYTRGERVLAALDARIRNATDRRRTLQDAFRRVNRHDGPVTYEDFATIVRDVSGESQTGWLDAHVAGPRVVSKPASSYAYSDPDVGADADGDGLRDAIERRLGTHPFDPDLGGVRVVRIGDVAFGTGSSDEPSTAEGRNVPSAVRTLVLDGGDR